MGVLAGNGDLVDAHELVVGVEGDVAGRADTVKVDPLGLADHVDRAQELFFVKYRQGIFDCLGVAHADGAYDHVDGVAGTDIRVGDRVLLHQDQVGREHAQQFLVAGVAQALAQPDDGRYADLADPGQLLDRVADNLRRVFQDVGRHFLFLGRQRVHDFANSQQTASHSQILPARKTGLHKTFSYPHMMFCAYDYSLP